MPEHVYKCFFMPRDDHECLKYPQMPTNSCICNFPKDNLAEKSFCSTIEYIKKISVPMFQVKKKVFVPWNIHWPPKTHKYYMVPYIRSFFIVICGLKVNRVATWPLSKTRTNLLCNLKMNAS